MTASFLLWSVTVFGVQCDDRKTTLGQAVVDLLPLLQGTVTPLSLRPKGEFQTIQSCQTFNALYFDTFSDQSSFSLTVPLYQPSSHPPKDFPGSTYKVRKFLLRLVSILHQYFSEVSITATKE